jgi:hypothetical protein
LCVVLELQPTTFHRDAVVAELGIGIAAFTLRQQRAEIQRGPGGRRRPPLVFDRADLREKPGSRSGQPRVHIVRGRRVAAAGLRLRGRDERDHFRVERFVQRAFGHGPKPGI